MEKLCTNCKYSSGFSNIGTGKLDLFEIKCQSKGKIRTRDPYKYVTDCSTFETRLIEPVEIIEKLKLSPILRNSLEDVFKVPSNSNLSSRGISMVMLSDDNLPLFENDSVFKNYSGSNHRFADLFGSMNAELNNPIIFWLANNNPAGCKYMLETSPIIHHVLQLGNPYSLEELLNCLCKALKYEKIKIVAPWFLRDVDETIGTQVYQVIPACKGIILEA